MTTRIGVGLMAVLLAIYLVVAAQYAVVALASGTAVGVLMGIALVLLPILGGWALVRELTFGARAERLGRRLEEASELPDEQISVRPSGRPDREEADALFPRYRAEVEASPEKWQAWYRLGLAYDAGGDRRRARQAIRRAISLDRGKAFGSSEV